MLSSFPKNLYIDVYWI